MSIIQHHPERAIWWADQEQKINGRFSKDRASYAEMISFAQNQTDMFNSTDESIACFCGD
jgi:hypothetical protein